MRNSKTAAHQRPRLAVTMRFIAAMASVLILATSCGRFSGPYPPPLTWKQTAYEALADGVGAQVLLAAQVQNKGFIVLFGLKGDSDESLAPGRVGLTYGDGSSQELGGAIDRLDLDNGAGVYAAKFGSLPSSSAFLQLHIESVESSDGSRKEGPWLVRFAERNPGTEVGSTFQTLGSAGRIQITEGVWVRSISVRLDHNDQQVMGMWIGLKTISGTESSDEFPPADGVYFAIPLTGSASRISPQTYWNAENPNIRVP